MTVVSIAGVAIGVGALVLVLSVMGGFEADLRRKMLTGEPHLEVISATNALGGFSLKEYPLKEFKKVIPEAAAIEPFVTSDVVLKRRGFVTSAILIGVRPEMEGTRLWAFDGAFSEGDFSSIFRRQKPEIPQQPGVFDELPGIALGDKVALQIGADVGDEITVLSPQASPTSALAGGTLARRYVVTGKISTGQISYDSKWTIASLDEGRYFMADYDPGLAADEYVTGVAINVSNPLAIDQYVGRLKKWADLTPKTWQMTNKSLLFALKLEKFTMGAILMLIVLVAAFSIGGTMIMTVFHKRAQVSILRALGMTQGEVLKLFLAQGLTIGTVGVVFGLMGGLTLCYLIRFTKMFPLPEGIYYLRMLPVKFLPLEYCVICLCAWGFALLASAYPAIAASHQNPSDGVRCE